MKLPSILMLILGVVIGFRSKDMISLLGIGLPDACVRKSGSNPRSRTYSRSSRAFVGIAHLPSERGSNCFHGIPPTLFVAIVREHQVIFRFRSIIFTMCTDSFTPLVKDLCHTPSLESETRHEPGPRTYWGPHRGGEECREWADSATS